MRDSPIKYAKADHFSLKTHALLDERWLQERIAEDPSLLGRGDLVLKDKERRQPGAGRFDLLLQDADTDKRYEVEVQLGRTDESHIIRAIEYWDNEQKLYPQYDHAAVLVAEDITSRFLNVISLFNGSVPLIAIQLTAIRLEGSVSLVFTKVLDEMRRGPIDEDEEGPAVDRAYWETRATKKTLAMMDEMFELVRTLDPALEPKYNKLYIGLAKNGQPNNFLSFRPKKDWLRFEFRLDQSDEIQAQLDESGLDIMAYDTRYGKYRIRLGKGDITEHREFLTDLMKRASSRAT